MKTPHPLTAPGFGPTIVHGFFGRLGGVSEGLYRGLNCGFGSGDEAEHVATNRARVAAAMNIEPEALLTVYQTHSPAVHTVTAPHSSDTPPRADAMVTAVPELGLAILTADCAPVLLSDETAGVIGVAHAGWKGALGGILENTLAAMIKLGARAGRTRVAIGPAISQANYEVGDDFRDRFLADDSATAQFFAPSPKPGHTHFDLPSYCAARLQAAGAGEVYDLAECTYADEERFFSYRRSTHRGEPGYGRNISVIVLRP